MREIINAGTFIHRSLIQNSDWIKEMIDEGSRPKKTHILRQWEGYNPCPLRI